MNVVYGRDFKEKRSRTADELIGKAQKLIPVLRERADKAESIRRLPDETVSDLREAGLSRLMQPARIGGAEAEIGAIVDVMIPIACGCPSTAWCLAQYIMHNYMIARWPAQAQEAVWQDPASLVSGILIPRLGRAHAVDGGYLISGAWPFVSGVEPSDWCMLSAYVERADTANEERYFLVRTSSIAILDTWHSIVCAVRAARTCKPTTSSYPTTCRFRSNN